MLSSTQLSSVWIAVPVEQANFGARLIWCTLKRKVRKQEWRLPVQSGERGERRKGPREAVTLVLTCDQNRLKVAAKKCWWQINRETRQSARFHFLLNCPRKTTLAHTGCSSGADDKVPLLLLCTYRNAKGTVMEKVYQWKACTLSYNRLKRMAQRGLASRFQCSRSQCRFSQRRGHSFQLFIRHCFGTNTHHHRHHHRRRRLLKAQSVPESNQQQQQQQHQQRQQTVVVLQN